MLKCSPEAFARCPTRELCGRIQDATFTENSECDLFNQSVANQPLTNADRIRSMSDEELADLLNGAGELDERIHFCQNLYVCENYMAAWGTVPAHRCKECLVKWLQQPAKEE